MQNDLLKQWSELNQTSMDAFKELGEINSKAMTRLTQKQMEIVNLYMESGAKQLQALGDAKSMQDVIAIQTKLFAEMNEKLMENARQTMEVLVDVKSELTTWAEKGVELAKQPMANVFKK